MVVVGSYDVSVICRECLVSLFHDLLVVNENEVDIVLHGLHYHASAGKPDHQKTRIDAHGPQISRKE